MLPIIFGAIKKWLALSFQGTDSNSTNMRDAILPGRNVDQPLIQHAKQQQGTHSMTCFWTVSEKRQGAICLVRDYTVALERTTHPSIRWKMRNTNLQRFMHLSSGSAKSPGAWCRCQTPAACFIMIHHTLMRSLMPDSRDGITLSGYRALCGQREE